MKRGMALAVCAALSALASADFFADFEFPGYNGSPGGTMLTGQQGWTNPVAGSNDANVHTYAGNTLGVALNPLGGNQFAGGVCGPTGGLSRAQHANDFTTSDQWGIQFDQLGTFLAGSTALNNLGGFSLQNSTTERTFNDTWLWIDPTNPGAGYNNRMNAFDAAGVATNGLIIGPAWDNQVVNRWYRHRIEIDFQTNLIMSITHTDMTTNVTTTVNPTGWYMLGGANYGTTARATGFRLFTGGGAGTSPNGNVMAWDNVVVPEPASIIALAAGGLALLRRRRR